MKKHVLWGAVAAAAFAAPAAAATDAVAAVNGDLAKLRADVAAGRATIVADAQKLATDTVPQKDSRSRRQKLPSRATPRSFTLTSPPSARPCARTVRS